MTTENRDLMSRFVEEIWNRGNFDYARERVSADYTGSPSGETTHGPAGYIDYYARQRQAFPDIHYTVEDQIAEGDKVVTRWTARATHTGVFEGIPPTGRQGTVSGITIYRFADGKLVQGWTNFDALGLLQQLGVIPRKERAASA